MKWPTKAGFFAKDLLESAGTVLKSTRTLNLRASLLGATQLLNDVALDKYTFLRQAYLARRLDVVHDGAAPMEKFDDEPAEPAAKPPSPAASQPAKPAPSEPARPQPR